MTTTFIQRNQRAFYALGLLLLLLIVTHPSFAAGTGGGGLPFDDWFTRLRQSITGPFAFAVSVIGLVGAGSTLIFGGDMNGFLRTLVFMVLVLSLVIAAQNTLSAITGQGAVLAVSAMTTNTRLV